MVLSCGDGQDDCLTTSDPGWRSLRCHPQPAVQPMLLWPPFLVTGAESKLNLLLGMKFQNSSFPTPMSETSCVGVLGCRPERITEAIPALNSFLSEDRLFASAASYQFLEDAVPSTAATERDMTKWVLSRDERLKIASAAPAAAVAATTEAQLPNSSPYARQESPTAGASLTVSIDDEGVPVSPCESVSPFAGVALPPAGPSSQGGAHYSDASGPLAHNTQPPIEPLPPPQQQLIWPTHQGRVQEQLLRLRQREGFELHPPCTTIDDQYQLQLPTPPTPGPCGRNNATGTTLGQHHTITQGEGFGANCRQVWQNLLAGSGGGGDGGSLLPICASPFLSAAYAPWRPPTPPTPGKGKETGDGATNPAETTAEMMATGAEGELAATPAGPSEDRNVSPPEIRGTQQPGTVAAIPQPATEEVKQPPSLRRSTWLRSTPPVLPRSSASTSATFWHSQRDNCIPFSPILPRSYSLRGTLPARSASTTAVLTLDPTRGGTSECTRTPMATYVAVAAVTTEAEAVAMEEAQRPKAAMLRFRLTVEEQDRNAAEGCREVVSQEAVVPVPVDDGPLTSQTPECESIVVAAVSVTVPALELPGVLYLRLMPLEDASGPDAGQPKLPAAVIPTLRSDVAVPPKSREAEGSAPLPLVSDQGTFGAALPNEASRRDTTQAASLAPLLSLPVLALPPHVVPELWELFVESIREGLPGAPPQRLRQLEALLPGGGTAGDGDTQVDADAGTVLLHCAQHQQCRHPYIHGNEYGVERGAAGLALRSAASSPTRNCTPMMSTVTGMQPLSSFPYCTEPVVCAVTNQLRTLLSSQELRNRWPLPRELAAAVAWVWQEHFMPLLNDLAAVLSYEGAGLNREGAAAAVAERSAVNIVDIFGRLFGFLESVGNKEQLLSLLACEATWALQACVSATKAQTAAATVPSVVASDKVHTGYQELEAAVAMAKEGELPEIGDRIAPTGSPPPPSPLPLPPSAPPSSTPAVLAEMNGAEARDSIAYGFVSVGGNIGGTSINSWSQWEEGGALAVDPSVHPPLVSVRHLARSFSEAVLASGIGAVGLLGLNIPKWRPAGGGGDGSGGDGGGGDGGDGDGSGGDGGSGDGGGGDDASATAEGIADLPRLLCGPWDVAAPSSGAATHSPCSPSGRSNNVIMSHEVAGSGVPEYDHVAAAAEPMAFTVIPQCGGNKTRSLMTAGGVETGSGVYVDSSRYRLATGATSEYGNEGRHMFDYLHDGGSNARPNNVNSSSCGGGYGFDFLPMPPPAPKRARGPPLPPPEYDTFEAQWQAREAEFGPGGQARDGPACRLESITALLGEW
ncbi:hypothetical protein Vafri_12037 [Volvox africanus]|uniref:Uncharacterized protein n=1 Tax=Volvox africanus TaxID=51714 RepID=A0A8J4BDZ3_9CHLO|nr:hypothetical protein Vafri_12037 [Volvox africanus]